MMPRLRCLSSVNAFPHLQPMDGNIGIHVEAQSYFPATNLEHRDLEHAPKPIEPPTITDSWLFLVKTNMIDTPFLD